MESLTDRFAEFSPRLAKRAGQVGIGGDIELPVSELPLIELEMQVDDVTAELRGRYGTQGLLDNLVIGTTRCSSTELGVWLLACQADTNETIHRLHVGDAGMQIVVELLDPAEQPDAPQALRWSPRPDVEQWLSDTLSSRSHHASGHLRQEDDSYYSAADWAARSLIWFSGTPQALGLLAEFFLNFGLEACEQNYEYLMPASAPTSPFVLDATSFECRVENADARNMHDA